MASGSFSAFSKDAPALRCSSKWATRRSRYEGFTGFPRNAVEANRSRISLAYWVVRLASGPLKKMRSCAEDGQVGMIGPSHSTQSTQRLGSSPNPVSSSAFRCFAEANSPLLGCRSRKAITRSPIQIRFLVSGPMSSLRGLTTGWRCISVSTISGFS